MNLISDSVFNTITSIVQDELEGFEEAFQEQFHSRYAFLQPLLDYLCWEKGKRIRPLMFFLAQGMIRKPSLDSVSVAVMIELVHTASLIHDDVIDQSTQRRGKQTLNSIWGNQISVLLGDYFFAKVLSLGVKQKYNGILTNISEAVLKMGRGELRQAIDAKHHLVSAGDYLKIIQEKTASLFGTTCALGGITVQGSPDEIERLQRIGENFGMAFQIRDDMLDFCGETEKTGKPMLQDVLNGKISAPLVFSLESRSEQEKKEAYQKLIRGNKNDQKWLTKFIKNEGGMEKAQDTVNDLISEILDMLSPFSCSEYRDAFEKLIMYEAKRTG